MPDELFPEVARTPRPRDEIWDALVVVFGEPTTRSNRSLRNKIVASLREAEATYAEIIARAYTWPSHFPGATLTETALEVHWDRLGRPPLRATELQAREYEAELDRLRLRAWADEEDHETDRGRYLPDSDYDRSS
jgi:hypothetical protein